VGLTVRGGDGDCRGRKCAEEGRWWTGGVEGGAVEERTRHVDVDERDGAKSGTGGGRRPFYGGSVAWRWERAGGSISVPRGGREWERVRLIEWSVQQRPGRGAAWPHHASGR
jgi:hypothetical protein